MRGKCCSASEAVRLGYSVSPKPYPTARRVMPRSARAPGGCLDLAALSIVAGKSCWVLCVDGLVLGADGSVLDALTVAVKARAPPARQRGSAARVAGRAGIRAGIGGVPARIPQVDSNCLRRYAPGLAAHKA